MNQVYLLISGQRCGPYTEQQLKRRVGTGQLPLNCQAWHEGLASWTTIEDLLSQKEKTPERIPDSEPPQVQELVSTENAEGIQVTETPTIYLLRHGETEGPFTEDQVRQSIAAGFIRDDLPGWHEGLDGWTLISTILDTPKQLVSPPPIPPWALRPLEQSSRTVTSESQFPWYRSSTFVGLIIGIPWLFGSLVMGPILRMSFIIPGLVLMATGPIFYKIKGELKTLPNWYRWLGRIHLLFIVPVYLFCLVKLFTPANGSPTTEVPVATESSPVASSDNQPDGGYVPSMTEATDRGHHSGASACLLKPDMTNGEIDSCAASQALNFGYVGDMRTAFTEAFEKGYLDQLQKENGN